MRPSFVPGVAATLDVAVADDMCPAYEGRVVHPVCSTWSLVHQAELAARKLVLEHLDPDEEMLGVHVMMDHEGAAPVGTRLRVRAELVEYRRRRASIRFEASDGTRRVARGLVRFAIVRKEWIPFIIASGRVEADGDG